MKLINYIMASVLFLSATLLGSCSEEENTLSKAVLASASALDFATDAALRKSLNRLDWRVTTFLVSQRSSSIQQADLILVLDNGTLAGKGTHAELLRTCDTYREIYFSQFPEERARYSSVSAGNIMKEVTV